MSNTWLWVGGVRPRELPHWAYQHLVLALRADPNYISTLRCVEQEDILDRKTVTLIRVFDPSAAGSAGISDFASLDKRTELIVYEGYTEKDTGAVRIERGPARKMS